jgi:branched-chain amino acid transport system permease protein
LRERGASPLTTLVASLGVLAMLQSLLAAIYTPDVLTFPSPDMISVGAFNFTPTQIMTVVVAIVVYAVIQFLLTRTDFGRRVRAVAANPTLAAIAGLSPQRVYIQVFALSSALAGLASVLTALDFGIQPYTGTYILLTASVAMIAGGRRSITGAFLVAIAISVLQSEFILVLPGDWGVACTFFVFLVFMLFRPEGLFRPRGSRS